MPLHPRMIRSLCISSNLNHENLQSAHRSKRRGGLSCLGDDSPCDELSAAAGNSKQSVRPNLFPPARLPWKLPRRNYNVVKG
jgi:hypothetical protein